MILYKRDVWNLRRHQIPKTFQKGYWQMLKRALTVLTVFSLLALPAVLLAAEISKPLENKLATSASDELIPITIRMTEQITPEEREFLTSNLTDPAAIRLVVTGRLKEIAASTQTDLLAYLHSQEELGKVTKIVSLWIANVVACSATPDVIWALRGRSDASDIDYDFCPDTLCDITWGLTKINADDVWNLTPTGYTGNGCIVCMVDTGVYKEHHDLQNQIWNNADEIPGNNVDDDSNGYIDDTWGWNFYNGNNNPEDYYGHGTHTAGTVGGDGDSGTNTGVAPDVQLMVCCVGNDFGSWFSTSWNAYQYAADNGANFISFSMGAPYSYISQSQRITWRDTCINCIAAGTLPVVAIGNERGSYTIPYDCRTPGDVPEIIGVGATSDADNWAWFTSQGPVEWNYSAPYDDYPYPPGLTKPDISAPGGRHTTGDPTSGEVLSCLMGSPTGYTYMEGTSMATPHVAGLCALIYEANPTLTFDDIKSFIYDNSVDLGPTGEDNDYGWGRIDALATINAILGYTGVEVAYFTATAQDGNALLKWAVKPNGEQVLGYNLYRGEMMPGATGKNTVSPGKAEMIKINNQLITGDNPYTYVDTSVTPGTVYVYHLEAVFDSGSKVVSIADLDLNLPTSFSLAQNYPNPFSSATTISFDLPTASRVELSIFDLSGRKVTTLVDSQMEGGTHKLEWNGVNSNGEKLPSGLYICRLSAGSYQSAMKMILTK
jgi:serine protease AprX